MARPTSGGRTPFGRANNKAQTKTDSVVADRRGSRFGILKEHTGNYEFKIQLFDRRGRLTKFITRPIRIEGDIMDLAARETPDQMVGNYLVRVDYTGPSPNTGVAFIISNFLATDQCSREKQTEQATQLPHRGASFARPGAGSVS